MTEKVKVSKELATAIETALEYCGGKNDVLQEHIDTWSDDCIPLNSLSFLELAEILVNGYEVEQTPEEKIQELYTEYNNLYESTPSEENEDQKYLFARNAIIEVLDILGMRIKGVSE